MTDAHLWADTYDRKLIDIFSVESEIAKTIADTLQVKLTGSEKQMMAAQPTTTQQPTSFITKEGRFGESGRATIFRKQSSSTSRRSRAIQTTRWLTLALRAPIFWRPFTLARTGARLIRRRKRRRSKLFNSIPTSLKRTSRLAKCSSLAKSIWPEPSANTTRDRAQAERRRRTSLVRERRAVSGRTIRRGHVEGRRSVELDPLSVIMNVDLGVTYLYAHRYEECARQLRKTLELDPTSFYTRDNLAFFFK